MKFMTLIRSVATPSTEQLLHSACSIRCISVTEFAPDKIGNQGIPISHKADVLSSPKNLPLRTQDDWFFKNVDWKPDVTKASCRAKTSSCQRRNEWRDMVFGGNQSIDQPIIAAVTKLISNQKRYGQPNFTVNAKSGGHGENDPTERSISPEIMRKTYRCYNS